MLEELLESAGILRNVSTLNAARLGSLLRSGDLEPELMESLGQFLNREPRNDVRLAALKDEEMVVEG